MSEWVCLQCVCVCLCVCLCTSGIKVHASVSACVNGRVYNCVCD